MDYNIDKALFILKTMGNEKFDMEDLQKTETYEGILKNMECFLRYPDGGGAGAIAYWEERGLKKELHEADDSGQRWASYLPMRYVMEESSEEKFPLLFVLHGANNSISLAESYGYTHLAGREELIVIIPENESEAKMEELFAYAKEHYPVDWSRVYLVGYSLGGIMTARHCIRWPERFAGVGVGGMLFSNGSIGSYWHNGVEWPGEAFTEENLSHAALLKMPVCICMGEREMINLLPVTEGDQIEQTAGSTFTPDGHPVVTLDLSSTNKIASINNWRRISGGNQLSEEAVRETVRTSEDVVTKMIGYPFDETGVVKLGGLNHFIGDSLDEEGNVTARFAAIEKMPHWPNPDMPELVWNFISRFSRDPKTGTLIRRESSTEQ